MTPKEAQLKPWKLRKGGWFYVDNKLLSVYSGEYNGYGVGIPMSQLLRVLRKAGIIKEGER